MPLEYHESLKHYRRVQLDHIVEKRARAAEKALLSGQTATQYGKVACISNVQWVCRFANMIKEYVRSAGFSYKDCIEAMYRQCEADFPLRKSATNLGLKGQRSFRLKVISRTLENNPFATPTEIVEALSGTVGEASYQSVHRLMKEMGWRSKRDHAHFEAQRNAINAVVLESGHEWERRQDFADAVNGAFERTGLPQVSVTRISELVSRCGIQIKLKKRRKHRKPCPGDHVAFLQMLKTHGHVGLDLQSCRQWASDRGFSSEDAEAVFANLTDCGAVYVSSNESSLIASLTRQEAAAQIGVSKNRLKKWGRMDWSGGISGPAYFKASAKGITYYRHEDVESFVRSRGSNELDLSRAGQRECCVHGGKRGGRPRQVRQHQPSLF
jgi:hypothetical protein